MKALLFLNEAIQCLKAHLLSALAKWDSHLFIGTMELFGTLKGSLQFKNIIEHLTPFYILTYVQEYTRDPWNSLESFGLLSCLPP